MTNKKAEPASPARSTTPNRKEERFPLMIPANRQECTELSVLFRILTRRSWDELQAWHRACRGSRVEHLMYGLYVLTIPAGGAGLAA